MLAHWYAGAWLKAFTKSAVLPLDVAAELWDTWHKVYRGK